MKQGFSRFDLYLNALEEIFLKVAQSPAPAEALTRTNARTLCFMGQGLCRVYAKMHDRRIFEDLQADFKALEDLLGKIDYYEFYAADFLKDPYMPATVRMYMESRRAEHLAELDEVLLRRKWLKNSNPRISRMRKALQGVTWKSGAKEIPLFAEIYRKAVKKINQFYAATGGIFTKPEEELHELRRKLRWLSIYPHALQGAIQLWKEEKEDPALEKYLQPAILSSPFIVLPDAGTLSNILFLEANSFYALSWLIAETGKLKDACLRIFATAEGISATQFVGDREAMARAEELNAFSGISLRESLKAANAVCAEFFAEQRLIRMLETAPASEVPQRQEEPMD